MIFIIVNGSGRLSAKATFLATSQTVESYLCRFVLLKVCLEQKRTQIINSIMDHISNCFVKTVTWRQTWQSLSEMVITQGLETRASSTMEAPRALRSEDWKLPCEHNFLSSMAFSGLRANSPRVHGGRGWGRLLAFTKSFASLVSRVVGLY